MNLLKSSEPSPLASKYKADSKKEGMEMGKIGVDGKRTPGVRFEQINDQLMKDEEFKAEYERLQPRYEVISQIIEANRQHITQEE